MMENTLGIPKVIHYAWFGRAPLSRSAVETIESWRSLMPEYEVKQWDESNFDLDECPFVRDAYAAKKWAFVSDYVRAKVIYEYGGVYMDVGTHLLKSIDPLVEDSAFSASDWESGGVNTGLVLAAPARFQIVGELLDAFQSLEFKDSFEYLLEHTGPLTFGSVLARHGYVWGNDELWEGDGFKVYPSEYFNPKLGFGGFKTTENTYSTHLNMASWMSPAEQYRVRFINKWAPIVGDFIARKTARILTYLKVTKEGRG